MEVVDKNLDYFSDFMPYEEGKDISPTQFDDDHPLLLKINTIIEHLNRNYTKLDNEKIICRYYKSKRGKKFTGLVINLDDHESELLGVIRIYHRGREDIFYYTFQTSLDMTQGKETQRHLVQSAKSLGLQILPREKAGSFKPVIFCKFKDLDRSSFEVFYKRLLELAKNKNICLKYPF